MSTEAQLHVQRGQDELRPQMRVHRPADDAATPRIEDDGEIQEAGPRGDVGDVRDPQPIWPGRGELTIDEVRRRPRRLIAHRRTELPAADSLQTHGPHQASDTLPADPDALRRQVRADPGRAVGAARLAVDDLDLRREFHIGPRPRRQRPLPPRVVPAGGDTQHPAHGGDAMDGLVCRHELESLDGIALVSRANQAAAFERIARSSRSCRFSRRSRRSSSRSSVVRPSMRWPASSAACFTQFRIAWADGSNSRASCRWLFGIGDAPFCPNHGVSTKPGVNSISLASGAMYGRGE